MSSIDEHYKLGLEKITKCHLELQIYLEDLNSSLLPLLSSADYPKPAVVLAKLFFEISQITLLYSEEALLSFRDHLKINFKLKIPDEQKFQLLDKLVNIESDKLLKTYKYFSAIFPLLRYIKTSSVNNVPQGLLFFFENIANQTENNSINTYLFIREQNHSNFKFIEFIRQLSKNDKLGKNPPHLDSYFESINYLVAQLSYPVALRDNMLMLCALAHEIGHLLFELKPYLVTYPRILLQRTIPLHYKLNIGEEWIDQAIADVYGAMILGPAFIFAINELLPKIVGLDRYAIMKTGDGGYSEPSPRMRLIIALGALDFVVQKNKKIPSLLSLLSKNETESAETLLKHDWIKILKINLSRINSLANRTELFKSHNEDTEHAKISWELIESHKEGMYQHVFEHLKDNVIDFDIILNKEYINYYRNQFVELVPPCEFMSDAVEEDKKKKLLWKRMNSSDIPTILNYGWLRYFEILSDLSEGENIYEEQFKKKVNNTLKIIAKAVELSCFQKQYREQCGRI